MIYDIFFVLFFLTSVVSVALVYYSLRRINNLEEIIIEIQSIIEFSSNKLRQIDSTGHFESDDEVGFVFEEIKGIQYLLNNIFEGEMEESISAEGKEKE